MRGISPVPITVTTGKISTVAFSSFYIDVYFSLKLFHLWLFLFTKCVIHFIPYMCQIHFKIDECNLQGQRPFM